MGIAAFSRRISGGVLEGDAGDAPVHTRAVRGDVRRAGRPLQRWWVCSRTPWRCVGGRACYAKCKWGSTSPTLSSRGKNRRSERPNLPRTRLPVAERRISAQVEEHFLVPTHLLTWKTRIQYEGTAGNRSVFATLARFPSQPRARLRASWRAVSPLRQPGRVAEGRPTGGEPLHPTPCGDTCVVEG
jgi:hypothetical protein